MMRPMKLAGDQLMFGADCLAHLSTLNGKRALIVTGRGPYLKNNGIEGKICDYLAEAGMETDILRGVEPDPGFNTVMRGAEKMLEFRPDWIIALGGGSVMDAAKAMWVYYEHPELKTLADIVPPNKIPKLRAKARLACIPSTSGTASEVSRSVVITDDDTGLKYGIGDMEMMPDVAICDPVVTASMPAGITAETGMDALTHALEAYASNRANYVSDVLAVKAAQDIFEYLPKACAEGDNLEYRESMLNASMIAGMAFTNVSLGITHSIAHTLGSIFHLPHGLADAVVLPYVIRFNRANEAAEARYAKLAEKLGVADMAQAVERLNADLAIKPRISEYVEDGAKYEAMTAEMAKMALADGCTKTNPVIPTPEQMAALFKEIW